MNWKLTILILTASIVLFACQPENSTNTSSNDSNNSTSGTDQTEPATDLRALAKKLVENNAGVKEGEIVLVSGSENDLGLLEDIVAEVQRVGGEPLFLLNNERLVRNSYTEAPEKYDSRESKLFMSLARTVNAQIVIGFGGPEDLLADIPAERLAARGKANQPVNAEFRKNKVRLVALGNELYPVEWRAKRFDMPLNEYAKQFWESVNTDYEKLQQAGEKAKTAMAGKEIEVTHPNGTNLKMNIEGRSVFISDGVISDEDVQRGDLNVFLPAGEAVVTPVANSGEGKFIVERTFFQGKEVTNLTMNFEGGKLISISGEGPGFAALKENYEAGGDGKDLLGFVDIGINPDFKLPAESKLGNWISAGVVTVGSGNNAWANGENNAAGGLSGHLTGATVKIDGKTIIENGVLKL